MAADADEGCGRPGLWGAFLVVMGGWWLLGEMDVVPFSWGLVGPLAVIAAGAGMLAGRWGGTASRRG